MQVTPCRSWRLPVQCTRRASSWHSRQGPPFAAVAGGSADAATPAAHSSAAHTTTAPARNMPPFYRRPAAHGDSEAAVILGSPVYFLYSFLLAVAFAVSAPFYLWKGRGSGKYLRTLADRLGRRPEGLPPAGGPSIWIHAVSVGEVLAARSLVRPLEGAFPRPPRLRLHHDRSPGTRSRGKRCAARTGSSSRRSIFQAPWTASSTRLRPALLVLVETEIWPNLIHRARGRGARVAIVNGRISPRSFPRYRRVRPLLRHVLAEIDLFLMQGEAHHARLREMGAPADRVRVTGNLKYDALVAPETPPALRRALGQDGAASPPLVVAGSTVEGEEEAVLRPWPPCAGASPPRGW